MRTTKMRTLTGLFLVIGLSVSSLWGQQTRQSGLSLPELRQLADRLYAQERFDDARDAYLQIQPQSPNDPQLNRNLGWSFYRARRPNPLQAIHYWSLSWQVEENETLRAEAARAYLRLNRFDEGTRLLLDLARSHPQHPQHWRELASLAEAAMRYPEAITWYRAYLERQAGDVPARLALARLLGWSMEHIEAVSEYMVVLSTDPSNLTARLGVAQVLAWQGSFEESVRRYDEILQEQPGSLDAQSGKAFALLWAGRFPEAKPLFAALARRRPADTEVRTALNEIARLEAVAATAAAAPAPAVAVAAPPPPPPDPLATLRTRIDDAFREGNSAAAVSLLQQALQLAPGNFEFRRRLAQAHLLGDGMDTAINLLQDLRTNYPNNPEVLRDLVAAQVRAGKHSEAADSLAAYLRNQPGDPAARVEMARYLSWSQRFDEASRAYQEVLGADPANVESLVGLAQVNLWQGRYPAALGQFDAVLSRQPDQREALIGKSQALFWTGRKDEAYQLIGEIQQRYPQDRDIVAVLDGFRETERQEAAQAAAQQVAAAAVPPDVDTLIRSYQEVVNNNPREVEALRMLGELHARKSDFTQAAAFYRRVRAERPQDLELELTLARTLSWSREFDESLAVYRDVLRQDQSPATKLEMARVLSWAGEYAESVSMYQQVLLADPMQAEATLGLARVLSWSRNYDESLQTYRQVIEQEPGNREARVEFARVTSWKGDLDQAIRLYSDLQTYYPDDRDVLLGKGQTLQWAGRAQEAEQILTPLRAAYPDDREILIAMAGTQLALGRGDLAMRALQVAEASAPDDRDVQLMRSLILRQVRPVLTFGFNPSFDSDDLHILPYTSTLYFSPIAGVRSYVRGAVTQSLIPFGGVSQGREAVFGSTAQVTPWLILRGEIGANFSSIGEHSTIGSGGFTLLPSSTLRFDFDASRQFINYLPTAVDLNISRVQFRAGGDYRPVRDLLLHLDYTHGRYSDTNRSNAANFAATQTLWRNERLTVEGGYTYGINSFTRETNSGYFAPSQLQRHAALGNVYGRLNAWMGYGITGTFGGEQIASDPYRPDGTLRVSTDFSFYERFRFTLGYGYFRLASLARAGAYRTHSAFSILEIRF